MISIPGATDVFAWGYRIVTASIFSAKRGEETKASVKGSDGGQNIIDVTSLRRDGSLSHKEMEVFCE